MEGLHKSKDLKKQQTNKKNLTLLQIFIIKFFFFLNTEFTQFIQTANLKGGHLLHI